MRPSTKKLSSLVSKNGYKLTVQRKAVLNAIASSHEHLSPAEVYEIVKQELPAIGLVTVYRTLDVLSEMGLICRVHRGGRSKSYTLAPTGHHHHMVCTQCGAVADFTTCDLSKLENELSQKTGFAIEGHLLEFSGLCSNCQSKG